MFPFRFLPESLWNRFPGDVAHPLTVTGPFRSMLAVLTEQLISSLPWLFGGRGVHSDRLGQDHGLPSGGIRPRRRHLTL